MTDSKLFRDEVFEARKQRLFGEVVLTQPLSTRVMVLALIAIIGIAGVWVTQGTYARIETVQGILVTDIPTAKVYAPQAGIVSELVVKDGDLVKKGDKIAIIRLDRKGENGIDIATRGAAAIDARLGFGKEQIALSNQQMQMERQRLVASIDASQQQADSLETQIKLQQEVVASNQNIFDQIAKVVDRGFVSKVDYERRRQTLISSKQQLAGLQQQLSSKQAEQENAQSQLASVSVQSAKASADLRSQLEALSQQKTELEGSHSYVISAPISGRITALQIAEGRTTSSAPLMVVVPEGTTLKAEVYAPSRAIGFVQPGQETRILYDAFPYQRFGSFAGNVKAVSHVVIDPRETDVPLKLEEAVYRVEVDLGKQFVEGYGERVQLQPGMTLHANIVLERQSFLNWLLTPLNAVLKRTA